MGIGLPQAFAPFLDPTAGSSDRLGIVLYSPVGIPQQHIAQASAITHPFFAPKFSPSSLRSLKTLFCADSTSFLHVVTPSWLRWRDTKFLPHWGDDDVKLYTIVPLI